MSDDLSIELPFFTIEWNGGIDGCARLLDQTLLPHEEKYIDCRNIETMWHAIRELKVRGAPAIGVAAGMGVVLGVQDSSAKDFKAFHADLKRAIDYLASSRPTAVNLFWALRRMERVAKENRSLGIPSLKERLLEEAKRILQEDKETCLAIGRNGAELVNDGDTMMTHCNAGALATGGIGTALAVIYVAHAQGKRIRVFADETRPLLQGARITSWELQRAGIDVTVICDGAAAHTMKTVGVDRVIVGSDRIAANGDAANKIGTFSLAIAAQQMGVPFNVAAPVSTFDPELAAGNMIPIEERDGDEVARFLESKATPEGVHCFNPAFDVTPAGLIESIITERGVIHNPDAKKVSAMLGI